MSQKGVALNGAYCELTSPALEHAAIDANEYKGHVIDYVNMFINIYRIDKAVKSVYDVPKFSIKELLEDLGRLPKKEREALLKFFGISSSGIKFYLKVIKQNDVALWNMITLASDAAAKLRTSERMYRYNPLFQKSVDLMASKVHDPECKYTNLDKARFAHLYFWFVKDYQFMPYDVNRGKGLMSEEEAEKEKEQYPAIESYVTEATDFFANIPDGDIVIPQIIEFIWEADPELDSLMVEFAELQETPGIKGDHGVVPQLLTHKMCDKVRAAKEKLFAKGSWSADYMRISEFMKMPEKTINELIDAYNIYKNDYGFDVSTCDKFVKWNVSFRTKGKTVVEFPKISEKRNFIDDFEMIYFLGMIDYLEQYVPQLDFHGHSFGSYGFGKKIA